MSKEQESTPLTEKPKVTVDDFAHKMAELDREVKYLLNKAKMYKPKASSSSTSSSSSTGYDPNDEL